MNAGVASLPLVCVGQYSHVQSDTWQVVSLFEWVNGTYEAKYRRVGVLAGTFYDRQGKPTAVLHDLIARRDQGMTEKARTAALKVCCIQRAEHRF